MGKLINQLLVLAKLDEVQENNERQEIDMKELVEKTVEPFYEDRKSTRLNSSHT